MGRTGLFTRDTEDDNSTDEQEIDDLTNPRSLRFPVTGVSSDAGPSGVASVRATTRTGNRLRRPAIREQNASNSNSTSNSPRQPSPKVPRLGTSANLRRQRASNFLERSPRRCFNLRTHFRVARIVDSDDEDVSTMNSGAAASADEDESSRDGRLRNRASRLWASTMGRHPTTAGSSERRNRRQQQLEADEALARRLQAQYDAQFHAEQQQRRRREGTTLRRRARAQTNAYRPLTPPLPPRMRDFSDSIDGDDEDEDAFEIATLVLRTRDAPASRHEFLSGLGRAARPRRGSPSGPTTLATVRRYFREAHLDADLFPDVGVSILDFETLLELADQLGDGAPSMTSAEINRLPTVLYRQVINLEEDEAETAADETPACAICMEKFADGDVQRNLPCFHMFHKNCVDVWLKQKSSCPVCRVDARRTSPTSSP